MSKLVVFNHVTLDGYFVDGKGSMNWAHKSDPEWTEYVSGNAGGNGRLLFGRVTYELMASYWPTPQAANTMPAVAEGMNRLPKVVFSRTLESVSWNNTTLIKGNLAAEVRQMKNQPGPDTTVLGSGTIVSQLAREDLVDEYKFILHPIVLGTGRTMFEGILQPRNLKLINSRSFGNGSVVLCYEPVH